RQWRNPMLPPEWPGPPSGRRPGTGWSASSFYLLLGFPAPLDEQAGADHAAHGENHAQGEQDGRPVKLGQAVPKLLHGYDGLQWLSLKDGHVAHPVQRDPVDGAGVVRRDGIAGDIAAGGGAGVGGHGGVAVSQVVAGYVGGVIRPP